MKEEQKTLGQTAREKWLEIGVTDDPSFAQIYKWNAVAQAVRATETVDGWRLLEPDRDPIQVSDEIYNRGWETMPHGIAGRLCSTLDMPMRRKCRFLKEPEEFHQPDERVTPKGDGGASSATHYASQSKSNKRDMGSPAGEPPPESGATPRTEKEATDELWNTLRMKLVNAGMNEYGGLFGMTNEIVEKLSAAQKERDELAEWKRQMLLVESGWNEQEVAKELNIPLGHNIKPNICWKIQELKSQLAEKQKELEAANTAFDQELSELRTLALKTSPWILCSTRLPTKEDADRFQNVEWFWESCGGIEAYSWHFDKWGILPTAWRRTDLPPLPPVQSVDESEMAFKEWAEGLVSPLRPVHQETFKAGWNAARAQGWKES